MDSSDRSYNSLLNALSANGVDGAQGAVEQAIDQKLQEAGVLKEGMTEEEKNQARDAYVQGMKDGTQAKLVYENGQYTMKIESPGSATKLDLIELGFKMSASFTVKAGLGILKNAADGGIVRTLWGITPGGDTFIKLADGIYGNNQSEKSQVVYMPTQNGVSLTQADMNGYNGSNPHPINTYSGCVAFDIAAPEGTPLYAIGSAGADVTIVNNNYDAGGGNILTYDTKINQDILRITTMHMSSPSSLYIGQKIKAGDYIGPMGNTGTLSQGAHAHIEMKKLDKYGIFTPVLNPYRDYIAPYAPKGWARW